MTSITTLTGGPSSGPLAVRGVHEFESIPKHIADHPDLLRYNQQTAGTRISGIYGLSLSARVYFPVPRPHFGKIQRQLTNLGTFEKITDNYGLAGIWNSPAEPCEEAAYG